MKRILTWLLAVGLAAMAAAGENLLPNEDLLEINDNGNPKGWWGKLDPRCGVDQEVVPEKGTRSMRIAGDKSLETTVKVKGGHVYNISFLIKTKDFKWMSLATYSIVWMKKGKYMFTDYKGKQVWDMYIKQVQGGRNWDHISVSCTAPKEADGAWVRINQTNDTTGTFWVAKWRMEEVEPGDPFPNRIAAIPKASQAMTLDSALDEKTWASAAKLSGYLIPCTGANAKFASESYATYDNEALWVLFRNFQPEADKLGTDGKMKRIDAQDSIEFFVQIPGREQQYHIILPVTGKIWLCKESWKDTSWPKKTPPWENNGVTFKIKQFPDRWVAALRLPFAGMETTAPAAGSEWLMNFCRSVFTGGKEETAWPFLKEAAFQATPYFGKIIFSGKAAVPQVSNASFNSDGTTFDVVNTANKPVNVKAALCKQIGEQCIREKEVSFTLSPKEVKHGEITFPQKGGEMRYLEVRTGDKLVMKTCGMPSQEVLSMGVYDPDDVRTQTLYLATDTPFFFSLNMQHNFPSKDNHFKIIQRYTQAFDLYMELPKEIRLTGFALVGMLNNLPAYKPSEITPSKDGKTIRYKMELPAIYSQRETYFIFFYECAAKNGTDLAGTYWFKTGDKVMPVHELKFRTMAVGKINKPFERMVINPGLLEARHLRAWFPKDTIKQYKRLGFNRLEVLCIPHRNKDFYKGDNPKTTEDLYDLIIGEMRETGEKLFISTFITSSGAAAWQMTQDEKSGGDADARAIGWDGKQAAVDTYGYPSLCQSYRGKCYRRWIDKLKNSIVFSKYKATWLGLDMELWPKAAWESGCFCPRCKKLFHEHCLKMGRKDYAEMDMAKVIHEGKDKDYIAFWNEFKRGLYCEMVNSCVKEVAETVKGCPSTAPLDKFVVSDWTSPDSLLRDGVLDYFEIAFFNTPDNNYFSLKERMEKWNFRKDLYCSTTYGSVPGCPDSAVTAQNMRENIYNAAAFGMQGISWYYVPYLEPRRMKEIIIALNTIRPFEDLIVDGRYNKAFEGSNPKMQLTRLDGKDESIIGVRAYGADNDLTGTISVPGIKVPMSVYDMESGRKLADITPGNPKFDYTAKKSICRLLYVGPQTKWEVRQKAVSQGK